MKCNEKIFALRTDYALKQESFVVLNDPFETIDLWISKAIDKDCIMPNAFVLSTNSSSRVVLLREFIQNGLIFFTNYNSRKGREIEASKNVSAVFHWPEMQRQVRIEGQAKKISSQKADFYWSSRPEKSRIAAIVSKQSQIVDSHEQLKNEYDSYQGSLERPANWGGFIIMPDYFEFWQGERNRLHKRVSFKNKTQWEKSVLYP